MLRIVINAQLHGDGRAGGVEPFLAALAVGLGRLDGDEEYVFVTHPLAPDWIASCVGPNARVERRPWMPGERERLEVPRRAGHSLAPPAEFFDALGADVVHFPFQSACPVSAPSVFNPHDLQHLHLPEHFTPEQIAWRESSYRPWCAAAAAVVADSEWVRRDLVERYGLAPDDVRVIPLAGGPPVEPARAAPPGVEAPFVLYPAQTWPHKNHLRLVEAIARVPGVGLVLTGRQGPLWGDVERRARELGVGRRVLHLGYVDRPTLAALYRRARGVVIPSLFEGFGLPLVEAFREGAPAACARVTCLPEVGEDAALWFDPRSVPSIAEAIRSLVWDDALRTELRERGRARARQFTVERMAAAYRALYRAVAARPPRAADGRNRNRLHPAAPEIRSSKHEVACEGSIPA